MTDNKKITEDLSPIKITTSIRSSILRLPPSVNDINF